MTVSPDYVIALVFNTYVPFPGWETKGFETLGTEGLGGQVSPHRCVAEFSGPRVREREEMGRGLQCLLALLSAPGPCEDLQDPCKGSLLLKQPTLFLLQFCSC